MIAWHRLWAEKEDGGLGIKSVEALNKAIIQKLLWEVVSEQDRIWVTIIKAK